MKIGTNHHITTEKLSPVCSKSSDTTHSYDRGTWREMHRETDTHVRSGPCSRQNPVAHQAPVDLRTKKTDPDVPQRGQKAEAHPGSTILLNDVFLSVIINTTKESFDLDKEKSLKVGVSPPPPLSEVLRAFTSITQSWEAPEGSRQRLQRVRVRNWHLCPWTETETTRSILWCLKMLRFKNHSGQSHLHRIRSYREEAGGILSTDTRRRKKISLPKSSLIVCV